MTFMAQKRTSKYYTFLLTIIFGAILYSLIATKNITVHRQEIILPNSSEPESQQKQDTAASNINGRVAFSQDSEEIFQDELFAPLLSLYRKKAQGELIPNLTNFRSGHVPRVLLWSRPFIDVFWKSQLNHVNKGLCPLPCEVVFDVNKKDQVDAVIVYLRGAKDSKTVMESLSPRDPHQPWIMLTFESPPLANSIHKTTYTNFNGLFNRTMMYRRDADIRVPHGFIVRRGEEAKSLPPSWVVPPVLETLKDHPRKLAVSLMSNCASKTNRLLYIRKFQNYAPVDIYGNCGTLKCGHRMYVDHQYNATENHCLKMAGENYLFYFAFENNFCTDYITEKTYNVMFYPIVPVVRGSADYTTHLPPNSYIDASKYSPKELAAKLLYLQNNPKEYEKYLEWRYHYQPSTIGGERTLCHLCTRLHDPDFYEHQVIEDFEDWFVSKSRCLGELII